MDRPMEYMEAIGEEYESRVCHDSEDGCAKCDLAEECGNNGISQQLCSVVLGKKRFWKEV